MDISTVVSVAGGVLASAVAGKDLLNRFLGPTADYLGNQTKDLVEKSVNNVNRVFRRAIEKTGAGISHSGQVNPRVFKEVCAEAPFLEDEFVAEYFGGVLASARTVDGKDDSAIPHIHLVKSLSSLQIRLHFTIYASLSNLLHVRQPNEKWSDHVVSLASVGLSHAVSDKNTTVSPSEILFALRGLIDSKLLSSVIAFDFDDVQFFEGFDRDSHKPNTIAVMPTEKGASLFLRALGLKGLHPEVISSVCVERSVTSELMSQLQLPSDIEILGKKKPRGLARRLDVLEYENSDLREKLDELEDKVDDLDRDLDEVKSQVEDLEPATK